MKELAPRARATIASDDQGFASWAAEFFILYTFSSRSFQAHQKRVKVAMNLYRTIDEGSSSVMAIDGKKLS